FELALSVSSLPQPDQITPAPTIAAMASAALLARSLVGLAGWSSVNVVPPAGVKVPALRRLHRTYCIQRMTEERNLDEFEALVADAIDALPEQVQGLLATVAVVVAEHGEERDAYGEYFGDGATFDYVEDRI